MKLLPPLFLAAAMSLVAVAGCNRSQSDQPGTSASATSPAAGLKAAPTEGRTILITASDTMKFSIVEIRAKPGEALAVTLKNLGTMPKFSMGHNWVLLSSGVDINAFAGDTGLAAKTDYIPSAYRNRILAATKLLGPNESDTAHFYAPTQPGRYEFLCSFPGHFQVGMKGELIVE